MVIIAMVGKNCWKLARPMFCSGFVFLFLKDTNLYMLYNLRNYNGLLHHQYFSSVCNAPLREASELRLRVQIGEFADNAHRIAYNNSTETGCRTLNKTHQIYLRWAQRQQH